MAVYKSIRKNIDIHPIIEWKYSCKTVNVKFSVPSVKSLNMVYVTKNDANVVT